MKTELIIVCPHCKNKVIPKLDGTCPSCRKNINEGSKRITQNKVSKITKRRGRAKKHQKVNFPSTAKIQSEPPPEPEMRTQHVRQEVKSQPIEMVTPTTYNRQSAAPRESASIFCQSCGRESQTMKVGFQQNVGVLIMRFTKSVEGNFCKECASKYFWSFTMTTLFLGWWGVISFIVTPFILLKNLFTYFGTLGLESPSITSPYPTLTEHVIEQLKPYAFEIAERISAGESTELVARSVALRAKVTPGQVIVFTFALVQVIQDRKP